jgi:3-oxoacyl-[acyl-carrier protein] reductase
MKTLEGKTAIVTGASRGIGRAIAVHLAQEGAKVLLTARDVALLDAAVDEITKAGGAAARFAADLSEFEAAGAIAKEAVGRFGAVDIVVNNAGATKRGDFEDLTDEDWQSGFALKFFGAVRLTRGAWPQLRAGRGSVVFISGSGGRTPGAQFTIGGSVNAALLSLTKALAEQGLADGVQVNCVNPGPVRTARFERRLASFAAERNLTREAALEAFIRQEKITRVAEPEEIAALVGFIVGPHGRSLQGALIDIDGGSTKTI